MDPSIEELETLIRQKVKEGIFGSVDQAVESIKHWLNEMDKHFFDEEMRSEDA